MSRPAEVPLCLDGEEGLRIEASLQAGLSPGERVPWQGSESRKSPGGRYPDCMRDGRAPFEHSPGYLKPQGDSCRGPQDVWVLRVTAVSGRRGSIFDTVPEGKLRHCVPWDVSMWQKE